MTDITPYQVLPDNPPTAEYIRPRLLMAGTALASAAVAMGFLALIAYYVAERAAVIQTGEIWLPDGVVIPLTQPNFMGVTMAFSVITVWWSVASVRDGERMNSYAAFGLTLLFGFAYIAQTAFLLTIMEMEILTSERSMLIYGVIGTHIVFTVVAMAYLLIMCLRTMGGEYTSEYFEGVRSSAMFWTVIVALYGVLWYVIYITK